jgi:hypothetical protein
MKGESLAWKLRQQQLMVDGWAALDDAATETQQAELQLWSLRGKEVQKEIRKRMSLHCNQPDAKS